MSLIVSLYSSPIGVLEISGNPDGLTSVRFIDEAQPSQLVHPNLPDLFIECHQQLDDYFQGKRTGFSLPLQVQGTDFQQQVWGKIRSTPLGSTITYKSLAESINKPAAIRAVGSATGKNQFALLIPCHRIVGSDGQLHGFAWGVWRKKWLLQHEATICTKPFR